MAFRSISLSPPAPDTLLYLWLQQSVSHCILQNWEIGQIDRRLAFHVKKCGAKIKLAAQPSRFGWNAHRLHLKMDDMTAPQKLGPGHLHHPPWLTESRCGNAESHFSGWQVHCIVPGHSFPLTPSSRKHNLYRFSSRESAQVLNTCAKECTYDV